jgi:hypothetical protein
MKAWTFLGIACLLVSVGILIFGVIRAEVVSIIIDELESHALLQAGSLNTPFWFALEPYLIALITTTIIGGIALYIGKTKRSI